ncbi:hypothetical protein CAPTEDRAFT_225310 [Capitella teleta]|uniref:Ionotropic glutamate receptor L-glutamate and glycine-binding domain-containing protein n=1 Tax=Capitella teleta TaxID=283909 RepID=R7TGY3_CAPTE|nr:hypothetical protein CAPTEDRAFT_225310 [Capitella teleta]|eukprot:ELT90360.1 hypothetical protein CAPTEDRAFT_225310 [Capitella teleta]
MDSTTTSAVEEVKNFNVASVLVEPYLMERKNLTDEILGNDRYEGFIKDYLDALAASMKFKYTLIINQNYGKKVDGNWTGVIGDVVNKVAHFAAAPLIVTVERETVVDFTWSILDFEAVFIMQQRHPKQKPKIESFEDLVKQMRDDVEERVDIGVTRGSSLAREMESSTHKTVAEAWKMIQKNDYLMKDSTNEGFLRARKDGRYAFLTDEQTAEYVLREEPCELEMIKAGFFKRRLAFAVANRDPLYDDLNVEILALESSGEKEKMYDRWWGENKCASGASVIQNYYKESIGVEALSVVSKAYKGKPKALTGC